MVKNNKNSLKILIIVVIGFMVLTSFNGGKEGKKTGFGCSLLFEPPIQTPVIPQGRESIVNIYLTDQVCTAQYDPVCADGFTYPNSCFADLAGKTGYIIGACTIVPQLTKSPIKIITSIVKVELYGPDGWITVYDGNIPIELSKDNTQQIVSEKIKEGIYTKIRITWGSTIEIEYSDGSRKTIEFERIAWVFDISPVEAIARKTINLMIDIPLKDSLQYKNQRIKFVEIFKFSHNLEERFELRKNNIGKIMSTTQLEQNEIFQKVLELRNQIRSR